MPFVTFSKLPRKDIFNGVLFGHYAHTDRATIGELNIAAGTDIPLHKHPHEQITYVVSGRFDFTVGTEKTVLEAGMAALIPGDVMHGGKTLTACKVIDVFVPTREEYRV